MPEDDYRITEQLRSALEAEARRIPLPFDFATSIAANLEDRPARRFSWFAGVPAAAAIVVLATIAVAVPLALTHAPTAPGPGATGQPGQPASAMATASVRSLSPTTAPTVDASAAPLTESQAVETARRADGRRGMSAANVASGPADEVLPQEGFEWADVPAGDTWVWLIVLSDGGPPLGQEGSFVVLDYFDGTIYGIQRWIS
jgi:hypothetical protein